MSGHAPSDPMSQVRETSKVVVARAETLLSGSRLDAAFSMLATLMVFGIVLDFRAHARGISFAEEGFLTPEHTFFYSMFLGVAALLGLATYRERRRGTTWVDAVPDGYGWGVVGVLVFGFAGVGDLFWHSAFGFEESFQALVSPSHIALGLGAALFLSSPLRAAWHRETDPTGLDYVPVVIALTLVLAIVSMFGGFVNPLVRPYPSYGWAREQAVVAMLVVYPLLFVGATLTMLRRFRPPPGSFLLAFTVPGLVMSVVEGNPLLALPALVAGLLTDAAVLVRAPTPSDALAMRLFAAVVPAAFVVTYFATVEFGVPGGIHHTFPRSDYYRWSIHVLGGTVVHAALAGVALTYLIAPSGETEGSA
jgi:hypothetical protein